MAVRGFCGWSSVRCLEEVRQRRRSQSLLSHESIDTSLIGGTDACASDVSFKQVKYRKAVP